MEEYGLNILEDNYEPKFGDTFILNEQEDDWNFNIFIFECINPKNSDEWYGYLLNQRKKDKYNDNRVNLNGLFYINIKDNTKDIDNIILSKCTYTNLELFIIKSYEINSVGIYGGPINVNFDIIEQEIKKYSNKKFIKIQNSSIKFLKHIIPDDKHKWIGLIP